VAYFGFPQFLMAAVNCEHGKQRYGKARTEEKTEAKTEACTRRWLEGLNHAAAWIIADSTTSAAGFQTALLPKSAEFFGSR
jgi:hypothetical protein